MQQRYNITLQHIYQAHSNEYAKINENPPSSSDSEEDHVIYVNEFHKDSVANDVKGDGKESEKKMRSEKIKYTQVRPVQPKGCCSKRTCYLLAIWTALFVIGVVGLTYFIQHILKKVASEDKPYYNQRTIVYHAYDSNITNSAADQTIVPCDDFVVNNVWHSTFDKLQTETAIRLIDVNHDGVDDIIVGFGTGVDGYNVPRSVCVKYFNGTYPCYGGAQALDGKDGHEIWRHYSGHEIYAVNCNVDLNQDGTPDCILGGRGGIFDAISGKDGQLLWAFWDKHARSDVMNLYTAQFIRDLDGDGVMDVLQAHGGDPLADAFSEKRLVGRLIIFSGKTGRVLRWSEVPDKKETYFSPVLYTLKNGTEMIVFGTGGETHPGGLYVIPLLDFYYGKIKNAISLYQDMHKGVMNPAILADLNKDGTVDIIVAMFNSTVAAFDGETFKTIWATSFTNCETYSVPGVGYFNNDDTLDFMVKFNYGTGFPVYYYSNITIVDGKTGKLLISPALKSSGAANPSPLSISMEGMGNDLFLYWIADCIGHEGEGKEFQFVQGTNVHEQSRADTCKLRFGTKGFSKFSVMNRKTGFPGKMIYHSDDFVDFEYGLIKLMGQHRRSNTENDQTAERDRRHIGLPDHGGFQRLIATGAITTSLSDQSDHLGYSNSIDVVFPVYWLYPAKVRVLTKQDKECVQNYKKANGNVGNNINIDSNRLHGNFDEGDEAVNHCLQNHTHNSQEVFESQSNHDPNNIHMGKLTVYRFNIKCRCNKLESGQRCSRILPMDQQGWGGYMGTLANGFFNERVIMDTK